MGKDKNTPFYSQLLNFNPNGYPVATLTGPLAANQVVRFRRWCGSSTIGSRRSPTSSFRSRPRSTRPAAFRPNRFNPLVTVAYDAARGINLYAKYATGYRSGGASSRSVTYREFGPEDVKSYEIGAKTEWFDRRLRVNAAAYLMNRTGSQVDFSTVVSTGGTSTRNSLDTINAPAPPKSAVSRSTSSPA